MFNKFSDRATHGKIADVKRDFWSDMVSGGLDSIGITRDIRDAAQPGIDAAKSILPPGGNIPIVTKGIIPEADISVPKPGFKITPTIAIGALVLVAIAFHFRKG